MSITREDVQHVLSLARLRVPEAEVERLTTDLQAKVIDRCLQLFGGYGFMDEYPISRIFRDARVMRIYAGTNEIMNLLIARSL